MTDTTNTPIQLLGKAQKLTTLAGTLGEDRQKINEAARVSQRTAELDHAITLLDSAVKSARVFAGIDLNFDWGEDEARSRYRKFVGVLKRYSVPSDNVFNAARADLQAFSTALERKTGRAWNLWKDQALSALPISRLNTVAVEDQAEAVRIREKLFNPGTYDDPTPTSLRFFQKDLQKLTAILETAPDLPVEIQGIFQTLGTTGVALSDIDDHQISLLRRTGTLGDRIILKVVH